MIYEMLIMFMAAWPVTLLLILVFLTIFFIRLGYRSNQPDMEKTIVPFYREARIYICKLIEMQRYMSRKYKRIDQATVISSIEKLEDLLLFYPYNSDEKMARFWRKYRYNIKILLPSYRHPGFASLLNEFEKLDSIAFADPEMEIWQPVSNALSKEF